jgi:hypothetical protein|nr:hypothetical protein [uncultured Flavobacterium sp.]
MSKKENHIKKFRHIVLMWFVLFSISPCSVKEALFYSVNTDYAKPLNKSKTSAPASSCSYSQNDNTQTSVVKKSKVYKRIDPVNVSNNLYFAVLSAKVYNDYSKTSGNSPPKYILYKRLKIDIA